MLLDCVENLAFFLSDSMKFIVDSEAIEHPDWEAEKRRSFAEKNKVCFSCQVLELI